MTYITQISSPVGLLTAASDGEVITGLWLEDQKYYASTLSGPSTQKELRIFDALRAWLEAYFAGENPEISFSLAPQGSPFRQSVWAILRSIPYGQITTYGAIAWQLAAQSAEKSVSAQAVGGAVGHNPVSILIPCHRVVGTDGSLTGYASGVDKKLWLLQLEGAPTGRLSIPSKATAGAISQP